MVGDPIVLVNRTSEVLTFVADGRHYNLQPGENHGYVQGHGFYAVKQNPLLGTENYSTLEYKSMVGIKDNPEWPCEPLTDEEILEALESGERFDRKGSGMIEKFKQKAKHARMGRISGGAGANALAIGGN